MNTRKFRNATGCEGVVAAVLGAIILISDYAFGANSTNVYPGPDGKLTYYQDARGNRIPDYSVAGYKGGGVAIPNVPVVKTLQPTGTDDTQNLRDAIRSVAAMPLDQNGIRGAILLKKGVYTVSSTITVTSGIVIRGEGNNGAGTIIKHVGTAQVGTFNVTGGSITTSEVTQINQNYVAVGATTFKVVNAASLSVGQKILIRVTPTTKWLTDLAAPSTWKTSDLTLKWEREITAVDHASNTISISGGITSQIDIGNGYTTTGNATIESITGDTRVNNVGFEDLILMSDYDRSKKDANGYYNDVAHADVGIRIIYSRDCWVRRVTGFFYWCSLVYAYGPSSNVTVEDCGMLDGVSQDNWQNHAGGQEYYFNLNGAQGLAQRCYGRYARHTFVFNGNSATGSVFLDCLAENEHLSCEPHQIWTHGVMFDNCRTDGEFKLNMVRDSAHGQRAANCMLWNITSNNKRYWEPDIYLDKPKNGLGQQWAIGIINNGTGTGIATPSPESGGLGEAATVESVGSFVEPRSLYLAQLKDRLGQSAVDNIVSPEQRISCQAVWTKMKNQYDAYPQFGDPKDLSWLPLVTDPPAITGADNPVFSYPPAPQTIAAGSTVVFSAGVTNATSFQWQRAGIALPNATRSMLVISNAGPDDAGTYALLARNGTDLALSSGALLTVVSGPAAANPGRLINLSILTNLAAGDSFTMGFVGGGAGTTGPKALLARAAGPSLAQLGVTDAHADPKIEFFVGSTKRSENDNWGAAGGLGQAFAQVGAFAYTSPNSKDAAVRIDALAPGNNSVVVSGVGGAAGTVIAELYDATPAANFTATTPRLINVSVLKQIAAGSPLTAGFVVGGTTAKTVLVRAIGPTLRTAFGLSDAMADPKLELFSDQRVIASNDNWGGDPQLTATSSAVGAFRVEDPASRDAMLLLTLAPGNYTAQASSVNNTSGRALVEVYEVP
jgi:hypothetical protein